MIICLVIAVLLFGSKLPDVMRNMGKVYSQFRRSLTDFQFQIEDTSTSSSSSVSERPVNRIAHDDDDDEPRPTAAARFQAPPADDAE